MTSHKFAVGQTVRFSPGGVERFTARPGELFKVLRLLPEEAKVPHCRIKSGRQRVVREDQLFAVESEPVTLTAKSRTRGAKGREHQDKP